MSSLPTMRPEDDETNRYATVEDFERVLRENMGGLYVLSLLLTGNRREAKQCFVGGLETCVRANPAFREWAHSWTKRIIIGNAIRELKPRPTPAGPSLPDAVSPCIEQLSGDRDMHFRFQALLALEDFVRFVFAMSVLEHYPVHDCALLLGCTDREVCEARARAFARLAESSSRNSV
jgi:hypothetical protein